MLEIGPWAEPEQRLQLIDEDSGLHAFLVIHSTALGPGVGGIRTCAYPTEQAAVGDAERLARAMTLKCAIAGLHAGGAKTVVMLHPDLDRKRAFRALGDRIEELGGRYHAAGDLGTTNDDIAAVASRTSYVAADEPRLAASAGEGVMSCIRGCLAANGGGSPADLTIAIQGCGSMGTGVARVLAAAGARLVLADIENARARTLADELGASVVSSAEIISVPADILSPCAAGGVIDEEVANSVNCWAICGAANNQLATPAAEQRLVDRGIAFVPDFIASAGAVILGTGGDTAPALVAGLEVTTLEVLREAKNRGQLPSHVATKRALRRIAAAQSEASGS